MTWQIFFKQKNCLNYLEIVLAKTGNTVMALMFFDHFVAYHNLPFLGRCWVFRPFYRPTRRSVAGFSGFWGRSGAVRPGSPLNPGRSIGWGTWRPRPTASRTRCGPRMWRCSCHPDRRWGWKSHTIKVPGGAPESMGFQRKIHSIFTISVRFHQSGHEKEDQPKPGGVTCIPKDDSWQAFQLFMGRSQQRTHTSSDPPWDGGTLKEALAERFVVQGMIRRKGQHWTIGPSKNRWIF